MSDASSVPSSVASSSQAPSAPSAASSAAPPGSTVSPALGALETFEGAFARFSTGVQTLASTSQVAQKRLEAEFSSLDACVKSHETQLKEFRRLADMIDELDKEPSVAHALPDYRLKLTLLKSSLDKLRDTKPRIDNGIFVRLMMGRVNLTLWKQADKINFKDEYNKFKSRTTMLFILWPCLQLALIYLWPALWSRQGELVMKTHQLWMLYYYLTLSLRENFLLANGSAILHWVRGAETGNWALGIGNNLASSMLILVCASFLTSPPFQWVYHHYLSMLISAMMLLFPNTYVLDARLVEMLVFGLIQGLVMLFQNNYQKKRLYTRKALGKAKAIDVDSTETLLEKPTDLSILVPMLFLLYAIELWFGASFIYHYLYDVAGSHASYPLTLFILGALFIVLGLGNAITTGTVLVSKSRSRQFKLAVQGRLSKIIGGQGSRRRSIINAAAAAVEGKKSSADTKKAE